MEERNITITIEPISSIPNLTVITIKGNLDLATSKYADEKILPVIEKGELDVILDLSNLEYLSSIGMMSLTQYHKILINKNRVLKLVKPSKSVYDAMNILGFAKRFSIYESIEAAIGSFQ